jgi:UDP-N-acetylmuramoylalanine--D-glutamate ligase
MRETVRSFRPVEHRLERVGEVAGVEFYNDSKATNVDAALKALEAFAEHAGQIVLILGGRGKNAPYAPLAPLIERKARALVVLGEDAERIESELKAHARIIRARDMAEAVRLAAEAARAGDVVLLAPACASWDMFDSFEHRGRVFKEAINEMMSDERGTMNEVQRASVS